MQEGAVDEGDQAHRGENGTRFGDSGNVTRGDKRGICECASMCCVASGSHLLCVCGSHLL